MGEGRTGVLLMQLGGPERREELEPFLYELFADPEVLRIGFGPLRRFIARTIARRRAPSSALIYEAIGWSPIRRLTEAQRAALAAELARRAQATGTEPIPVFAAMTCSAPEVEPELERMAAAGVTRGVLLPLYPQYSFTTTRSSQARLAIAMKRTGVALAWKAVGAWYREEGFLAAHAERIAEAVARMPSPDPERVHVLFSAHSLPKSLVEKHGDPYRDQIEETVALLRARIDARHPSSLAYQSKVGPVAWLGPSTPEEIQRLGREGATQVVVDPIAFVTEHVETLYEVAMLFRDEAARAGIPHFAPVPALETHPRLVAALADLVERRAADAEPWREP